MRPKSAYNMKYSDISIRSSVCRDNTTALFYGWGRAPPRLFLIEQLIAHNGHSIRNGYS